MLLAYAQLTGLLKSDLATVEIELAAALRALQRGDPTAARRIVVAAQACAVAGQRREAEIRAGEASNEAHALHNSYIPE
jgi:hypothetical protein